MGDIDWVEITGKLPTEKNEDEKEARKVKRMNQWLYNKNNLLENLKFIILYGFFYKSHMLNN